MHKKDYTIQHLQFLIACSMQKAEGGRRSRKFIIWSADNRHTSSHLMPTAKWHTGTISQSVLDTKIGQAPAESYIEHMKHTQAKSHDSKRLLSNKHKNTQQRCNQLMEW